MAGNLIHRVLADPVLGMACLDAADAQDSLMDFITMMWPVIEPGTEFMRGKVVEVVAEHLEAVAYGKIRRLLINIPPGPGWVENRVMTDHGPVCLGDICVGDKVLTHEGRFREVTHTYGKSLSDTVKVCTKAGRSFYATPEHMVLTSRGWIPAGELQQCDVLKVPISPDIPGGVNKDEARLLGYLVGDGSLTQGTPVLTSNDEEVIKDACCIAESIGFKTSIQRYEGRAPRVSFLGGESFREWLSRHGLEGCSSYTKRIPNTVLCSCVETIQHFVGGYWSADGNVDVREIRSRGSKYRTSATTVSAGLAQDIQEALTRLGIRSHLRRRMRKLETKAQPGGEYIYYTVEIHNERDSSLLSDCPIMVRKLSLLQKCRRGFPVPFIEDEINEVTQAGKKEVTCITVEGDHSLTWNGIAVTNCMKSLSTDVFWPAWMWGPRNMPDKRFVSWSYAEDLTVRDNKKTRRLIQSEIYQKFWSNRFSLTGDQNAKKNFENNFSGFKMASGVHGQGTGHRGDHLVIDDPHNVKDVESDVKREDVLHFFAEVLPTRVNNKHSSIVVIKQRVHEGDISGHILTNDLGYDHLCLPMEYESDHPFPSHTALGFKDWRTEEGELLWPERFDREQVEELKKELRSWGGEYACNPYEAPILMSDLTTRPVGEVKVGDELVGFKLPEIKEGTKFSRNTLTKCEVKNVFTRMSPVVKVTLDSGEVIRCTPDHKWFKRVRGGKNRYSPALVGDELTRVCPPRLSELTSDEQRMGGWLGGFFDGDGSVSSCEKRGQPGYGPSSQIAFYQGAGRNSPNCDRLEKILKYFGFEYTTYVDERKDSKTGANYEYRQYRLKNNPVLPVFQKFLHIAQPVKWVDRIRHGAYGTGFGTKERVISVEHDGYEKVYSLETTTGNYIAWGVASSNCAGQLQQRPVPRGGGAFKKEWLPIISAAEVPTQGMQCRGWDLAATKDGHGAFTVGLKMLRHPKHGYFITNVVRGRWSPGQVDRKMESTAEADKKICWQSIPQDPGQAGKSQKRYIANLLTGYKVHFSPETGSKPDRALPWSAQAEAGNVHVVDAPWTKDLLKELTVFPNSIHKDQADAGSRAFAFLSSKRPTSVGAAPRAV